MIKANYRIDKFFAAYCECALRSSFLGEGMISVETLNSMLDDCTLFLYKSGEALKWQDYSQAGHDFWLTRNRHGAGFWDGDWPEPLASELTELANSFSEVCLYTGDDGKVYC